MQKYLPIILVAVTLVCGTAGYIIENMPVYDALLNSVFLVVLNGGLEPTNTLIEIARWAGILFALDIIFTLVASVIAASAEDIRVRRRAAQATAVAVHGDGLFADRLAESLGDAGIRSDRPASFNAPCQVLLFSDDAKAVEFFNLHADKLSQAKEVYIGLDRMTPDVSQHSNVYAFNMAEICAQLYWEEHPVNTPEKIALVGDGAYAEALLTQALLVNIFDIEGGIEYRIYGNFDQYRHLHTQLQAAQDLNRDTLVFAEEPWHADLAQLAACDRIILCGASSFNVETAAKLQTANVSVPLHVRCENAAGIDLIDPDNAVVFGTSEQLCTSALVIQQHQHDAGKICDIAYRLGTPDCDGCARQSNFPAGRIADAPNNEDDAIKMARLAVVDYKTCLACPVFANGWRTMKLFTKESNYAVAAHDAHKMRLLEELGAGRDSGVAFMDLPLEERDRLQEIEHIRWCRFYFLNNWSYGENGKDPVAHTHHYLIPYDKLERKIKDYDGDAYQTVWLRNR